MLEIKTAVTEVIKNFHLKPVTKLEDVVFVADFILRTKEPIRVKFSER